MNPCGTVRLAETSPTELNCRARFIEFGAIQFRQVDPEQIFIEDGQLLSPEIYCEIVKFLTRLALPTGLLDCPSGLGVQQPFSCFRPVLSGRLDLLIGSLLGLVTDGIGQVPAFRLRSDQGPRQIPELRPAPQIQSVGLDLLRSILI